MATPTAIALTEQRLKILHAIKEFHDSNGYSPTIRELGEMTGLASPSTVSLHLEMLRRHELVRWVPNEARTLTLTPAGMDAIVT